MSNRNLARNIGSMGIAVFISRIFGLVRDVVMSAVFGTSWVADAFQVGYQIPNLLRKLFGEGALSSAFVPVYNEYGIRKGREQQINFALNLLTILNIFLFLLSLLGVLAAPLLVKLLAPGFDAERYLLTVKLTRIMFPYLYFIGFSSTLIAILNSHDKFFIPGLSSAFLNIGMLGILAGYVVFAPGSSPEAKITATAMGVVCGGLLQTIVNFPQIKSLGYKLKFYLNWKDEGLATTWKLFLPGVFGLAIRQFNLAADLIIASFLPEGSIAALNYGNRLMQLPLGIIGVSAGVAVLPLFSRYAAARKWGELEGSLRFSLVTLCYLMIPITGIILALGRDIVSVIFQRGAFNEQSLTMTNLALVFYSVGLVFYSVNRQIIPLFYARKNTRTPVKISAFIVVLNILLNLILMQWLQHGGLALATSLASLVQMVILLHYLKKQYPEMKMPYILPEILKIVSLTGIIYITLVYLRAMFIPENFWQTAARLVILLVIGGGMLLAGRKLIRFSAAKVSDNG